jgi:hypothetical protein
MNTHEIIRAACTATPPADLLAFAAVIETACGPAAAKTVRLHIEAADGNSPTRWAYWVAGTARDIDEMDADGVHPDDTATATRWWHNRYR